MWSCGGAGAVGRPRGSPGPDGEVWPDKQRTDYGKQAPISPYLDSARWVIGIGRDFYTKTPYSSDDDTYKSSSAIQHNHRHHHHKHHRTNVHKSHKNRPQTAGPATRSRQKEHRMMSSPNGTFPDGQGVGKHKQRPASAKPVRRTINVWE